jgi:serine protease Do
MRTFLKLTTFIFLYVWNLCAYAQEITKLVAEAEKAIFAIYTYDEYGRVKGTGTGFFIDKQGVGVTNFHVLDKASKALIKLHNKEIYEVDKILRYDADKDLMVFSLKNTRRNDFKYLTIHKEIPPKASRVFVIGNPRGLESTYAEGNVSAIRDGEERGIIIQISAPVSPGSSGSPVMDMKGRVVGVVTSGITDGQNLNFSVASLEIPNLPKIKPVPLSFTNPDLVILNVIPPREHGLVYHSISFHKDNTIVYCSFTNVQMAYGEKMLIWAELNKKDHGIYLQDADNKQKYYILSSSVGDSRDNGTEVKLGENKTFKLVFPPIPPTIRRLNIIEGSGNSTWSVLNIDLNYYRKEGGSNLSNIYKEYGLLALADNDYDYALKYFAKNLSNNPNDSESYNLMAVIAHLMEENKYALQYITKAIQIKPDEDVYYMNRFRIYLSQGDESKAFDDLNLAIVSNPTQPDYYWYRAIMLIEKGKYQEAKKDLDVCILKEDNQYTFYLYRAICKLNLNQKLSACEDAQKALSLSPNDKEVKEFIRQNCLTKVKSKKKN